MTNTTTQVQMSIVEACALWQEEKQSEAGEETEYVKLLKCYTNRWTKFFGDVPLESLTRERIWEYLNARAVNLSRQTVEHDRRTLKQFLSWCRQHGFLDHEPMLGIRRFRVVRKRPNVLNLEQQERLLLEARKEFSNLSVGMGARTGQVWRQRVRYKSHLYFLVRLAIATGFRRGTLLSICWGHIDLETRIWRIPGTCMKGKADYVQPTFSDAIETLKEWKAWLLEHKGPEWIQPTAKIFDVPGYRCGFDRLKYAAGLPKLKFHDLRRTFIFNARVKYKISLESTMALSDHHDLKTVLNHYRWADNDEIRDDITKAEADISARTPPPPACPRVTSAEAESPSDWGLS